MTKDEAYRVANALNDAGYSTALNCGVHERMRPSRTYSLHVQAIRLDADDLIALVELVKGLGMRISLSLGGTLSIHSPNPPR